LQAGVVMKQSEIIFMTFFWSKKDGKFILCYLNLKSKHADLRKQRGQQNMMGKITSNAVDSGHPQRKQRRIFVLSHFTNTKFWFLTNNVWFKQLIKWNSLWTNGITV